ncbi:hypothetical protein VIGAN_04364800 [Vigna angularis var. angularis]|uniref:Uncharacterized protein n=1 Tax=Vigna angularis var. angularis TaxID=157739 RepID=A0A0S3RZM3_PHAAN|nr:hypothetical protein VIGAN_04364800 [Vigna angularis var. angularis]
MLNENISYQSGCFRQSRFLFSCLTLIVLQFFFTFFCFLDGVRHQQHDRCTQSPSRRKPKSYISYIFIPGTEP